MTPDAVDVQPLRSVPLPPTDANRAAQHGDPGELCPGRSATHAGTRQDERQRTEWVGTLTRDTSTAGLLWLTTALSSAEGPPEVLDVMTHACPLLLGADLVNISLLEDDGAALRLVSSRTMPLTVAEEFATYPADAGLPLRDALVSGEPIVLRTQDDKHGAYPHLTSVAVDQSSFCVLPLVSGREPIGTVALGWSDETRMTDEVLALSRAVAVVCATALQRATLARNAAVAHRHSEAVLARLRALQVVAAELAHAVDVHDAAAIVLESALATLGAEAAALNVLDETATECTQIATLGLERSPISTRTRWSVRDSTLAQEVVRTGLPVLVPDAATRHERFPDLDAAALEQEAWANLLLSSDGAPLGIVSFGWREPREFDLDDMALLQALADHLSAALDRARLIENNAALLRERTRIAETLQQSLLPAPLPTWDGVVLSAGFEPAEAGTEVCGDFYDAFHGHDDSLILVIGDVTGRGVAAAGLTGMARHTLRALARDMSPEESLRRLNNVLAEASAAGGEPRLLTAAVARLSRAGTHVRAEISLAGHCLPILVRRRHAEPVGVPGTLLGALLDGEIGTVTIDLEPDDVLLLHTDGVIEARRHGTEFGEDRLLKLLSALTDPQPDTTVDHVLNAVRWYRTTAPDDIAVVALRVTGSSER